MITLAPSTPCSPSWSLSLIAIISDIMKSTTIITTAIILIIFITVTVISIVIIITYIITIMQQYLLLSPSTLSIFSSFQLSFKSLQQASLFQLQILIANNGIAAVKCMRSIRRWSYDLFGNDHAIRFVAMVTPEDLKVFTLSVFVKSRCTMVTEDPGKYLEILEISRKNLIQMNNFSYLGKRGVY